MELAIVETHVHAVLALGRVIDVPALVQSLKGASCRFVNQTVVRATPLRWASGYDLHSLSRRNLGAVQHYLDHQGEHHRERLLLRWSATSRGRFPAEPAAA